MRTPQLDRGSFSLGKVFCGPTESSQSFFCAHSTRKLAAKLGRAAGYIGIGDGVAVPTDVPPIVAAFDELTVEADEQFFGEKKTSNKIRVKILMRLLYLL